MLTLAPTVTLWDAGELITAAHGLGIPHPPGTPFFVLVGHVWGDLLPVGAYAWRLNLLSAVVSAAGAGFLFLCVDRALAGEPRVVRTGGAAAGALAAAFAFTAWQNANETEVYGFATTAIAAVCWLALRWRDARASPRAPRYLLLIVYLLALSVGNHLLGLLVGPALLAFVWLELRTAPAEIPAERRAETIVLFTVAAVWLALVAAGLGSTPLLWAAGALVVVAIVAGSAARAPGFPVAAALVALVGVSTYALLYVRSGLDPVLDMADPETWRNLLGVIRREQYPPRSPLDNPLFESGPDNPGRTLELVMQQTVNYWQYFGWQWAYAAPAVARAVCAALFAGLGVAGFGALARRDRATSWLFGGLWLVAGLGLVAYMNFKPGFSLFWDRYPSAAEHEVRERDYFFVASFQAWGVLAGVGLAALARRIGAAERRAAAAVFGLALAPAVLNLPQATRRGPDAWLARDFAYDLLQSVGPYGVIFVLGDNDTYPLWYAQAVEGVRRDVSVVNLSLANTDWYLAQLRRPPPPFEPAQAPWYAAAAPPGPLLDLPEESLRTLTAQPVDRDRILTAGHLSVRLAAGQVLYPRDLAVLLILQRHLGRRPIGYAVSSGRGAWLGMESAFVQRGLVREVFDGRPDSVPGFVRGLQGFWVDTARTRFLADSVYRYGGLEARGPVALEPAARQLATTLSAPFLELAQARGAAGDSAGALAFLRRAHRLSGRDELAEVIRRVETEGLEAVFGVQPQRRGGP